MKFSKLRDICCDIQYGYTQSSSTEEIGPKFLRITDIQDNKVNWETTPYCEITRKDLDKYRLSTGDIVVARTGATTGKSFLIKSPPIAVFASYLIKLSVNKELVLPDYLWWFMQSPSYWNHITVSSNGTTQPGVNAKVLSELMVPLPSMEEQIQITNILAKAQALIEKRKQAIEKLDELVHAVFLDMFGDPVSNNKAWSEATIGDLSTLVSSGSTPLGGSQAYKENGIPFIRSQNILMNKLMLDDIVYIDEETHNRMKRTWVKHNDVLLNITGASIGRVTVYEGVTDFANVNQHVCIIRLKDSLLLPRFCEYMISHPNYQRYIMSFNAGGTREAFNFQQIKKFKVICPPIAIQEKFLTVINAINKNRETNLIQLQQLESNFQALLQKAFKGELKVKDGVAV